MLAKWVSQLGVNRLAYMSDTIAVVSNIKNNYNIDLLSK